MYKVKVKFLKAVYPYEAGQEWELKQEQVDVLSREWLVEVIVEKEVKKASDKSMKGKKKATK